MKNNKQEEIAEEFASIIKTLKPEFGNEDHLTILKKLKEIEKLSKAKKTPIGLRKLNELKKFIIWIIKMDF